MRGVTKLPQPENLDRVETGTIQFGTDWPGIFIRGDNALHYAFALDQLISRAKESGNYDPFALIAVEGLQRQLSSCNVFSDEV